MNTRRLATVLILVFLATQAWAEYSPWTLFGGLNLIWNSDGEGVTVIPGMSVDGNPGGLSSAPSPLAVFFGGEYRRPLPQWGVSLAPSLSIYSAQYLWANDRPLPAEIENRTAYVPSLLLDVPVLWTRESGRFLFSAGAGPGFLARYGFLDSGVGADDINPGDDYAAGEQVKLINEYFWSSGRWFYPGIQLGVRYRLDTGWGGGFSLRVAYPLANLWSSPSVPGEDSIMYLLAVTITPPVKIVLPSDPTEGETVIAPPPDSTPSP